MKGRPVINSVQLCEAAKLSLRFINHSSSNTTTFGRVFVDDELWQNLKENLIFWCEKMRGLQNLRNAGIFLKKIEGNLEKFKKILGNSEKKFIKIFV